MRDVSFFFFFYTERGLQLIVYTCLVARLPNVAVVRIVKTLLHQLLQM